MVSNETEVGKGGEGDRTDFALDHRFEGSFEIRSDVVELTGGEANGGSVERSEALLFDAVADDSDLAWVHAFVRGSENGL